MEGMPAFGAQRKRRAEPRQSPLRRLNVALASPIASFVGAIGFSPGQLSIQSFTLSLAALFAMRDGSWPHMATGAGIVYVALLLDRADWVLGQRKGKVAPWTSFLGLVVDRLVEVSLLVGLGVLAVRGLHGSPIPAVNLLTTGWILVLATATAGLMMTVKALAAYSEVYLLRQHLLATRRLPGPSIISRSTPSQAVLEPILGRDEMILVWCLGILAGQLDLTLIVLVSLQVLLLVERITVFRMRLRDPEAEASRILSPDYV